jgi:hypothetical protein
VWFTLPAGMTPVVTVRGVSEVVEYRAMGPVVLINRDPKVRVQVEKIAKERP